MIISSFLLRRNDLIRVLCSHDRMKMVEVSKSSVDATGMINLAVPVFKMRMQEGINTYDSMIAEGGEKVKVVSKLLFQLSNPAESLRFLGRTIKDDPSDWANLKRELGPAVKPILGYPNGYYELDLSEEVHRFCFMRLCEISETIKENRSKRSKLGPGITGDVGQKGK